MAVACDDFFAFCKIGLVSAAKAAMAEYFFDFYNLSKLEINLDIPLSN